jgi:ribosomal protein RSM22 (predicted rRNA methylase)
VELIIYVLSPNNDSEYVAGTRDQLETALANTASGEYAFDVMAWFDHDHSKPLEIKNGKDLETWHVI